MWFAIALVAAHFIAKIAGRDKAFSLSRTLVGTAVIAAGIAGILIAGTQTHDKFGHYESALLEISAMQEDGTQGSQIVEEGAVYEVMEGKSSTKLTFGTTSIGPFAAQYMAGDMLLLHVPSTGNSIGDSPYGVAPRRPDNQPAAPGGPSDIFDLIFIVLAGIFLVWHASLAVRDDGWGPRTSWLVALIGLALLGPFVGPASGRWFLDSAGTPLFWQISATSPLDVGIYQSAIPAFVPFGSWIVTAWLSGVAGLLAVLLISARKVGAGPVKRSPWFALIAAPAFVAFAIAAVVVVGRIDVADANSLSKSFNEGVLAHIPGIITLVKTAPSAGAPYSVSLIPGLTLVLGLLAGATALTVPWLVKMPLPGSGSAIWFLGAIILGRLVAGLVMGDMPVSAGYAIAIIIYGFAVLAPRDAVEGNSLAGMTVLLAISLA